MPGLDILTAGDIPLFAVGFLVSMISAVIIIKAFLSYVWAKVTPTAAIASTS